MNVPHQITPADLGAVMLKVFVSVASLIVSIGVVSGAVWYGFQPRIDTYIEDKITAATVEITKGQLEMNQTLVLIGNRINGQPPIPFIEFRGTGILRTEGPFKAGGKVPLVFHLRRNGTCPTTVRVRFMNEAGVVDSALSVEMKASPAPITRTFEPFPVNVRLAPDHPKGRWSYVPTLIPDPRICPGEQSVNVPPSEFFDVE